MASRTKVENLARGQRNILGPALKNLRISKGLTQAKVLAKLQRSGFDISKQVYIYIERGSRVISDVELFSILKALNASLSDLEGEYRKFKVGN